MTGCLEASADTMFLQDDEESEDEEMIDASTIAIASDEAGDSETGNDEDGQAVVDKTNDSTLFDDDDPKKPLTWDAAQARRARWYERHNYVRQSRMIIMHAVETIEMQRVSTRTLSCVFSVAVGGMLTNMAEVSCLSTGTVRTLPG